MQVIDKKGAVKKSKTNKNKKSGKGKKTIKATTPRARRSGIGRITNQMREKAVPNR